MAAVRIVVRHDGVGWSIDSDGQDVDSVKRPRPYEQREEAISDALFAARMLRALGSDAVVCVQNSDGIHVVRDEETRVWRQH